jgi:hypothetical protein
MKRSIVLLLILGLLAGALAAPAEAAKKKKKKKKPVTYTMEAPYDNPAIGSSDLGGGCLGCPSFAVPSDATYMSVEITDSTGLPVPASISWDTDGDGISDTGFEICGKTEEAQAVEPGVTANVFVWVLPSTICPNGTATSGTVKVTLSSVP